MVREDNLTEHQPYSETVGDIIDGDFRNDNDDNCYQRPIIEMKRETKIRQENDTENERRVYLRLSMVTGLSYSKGKEYTTLMVSIDPSKLVD